MTSHETPLVHKGLLGPPTKFTDYRARKPLRFIHGDEERLGMGKRFRFFPPEKNSSL